MSPARPDATLSVVVGTYNRLDSLKRCIDSILDRTTTPTLVYVADAGSTDGTQDYLASIAGGPVVPVLQGAKLGQARAYNEVFRQVETPFVAWLSDDNEVVNHGLDVGVRILQRHRRLGMVGLKVADRQGEFRKAPYIGGITAAGVLNVNQGMLRTEVLREVGGFSETFGFYGIDADLTTKVLYAGHDVAFTRAVAIHHYRDWADPATESGEALKANQDRSLRLYAAKYPPDPRRDRVWEMKKALWSWAQRRFGARMHPRRRILGAIPRDWFNVLHARHIHVLDPWLHAFGHYHLVQHVPRRVRASLRPATDETLAAF